MQRAFSDQELADFPELISTQRFSTYLDHANGDRRAALDLYIWNIHLSAAFMLPLQLCEVAVRNGVVEAIEAEYGPDWHRSGGFAYSLPRLRRGYQPSADLMDQSSRQPSAGKVVAELKFAFWQYMFTKGQDARLWLPHFAACFPGYDRKLTIQQARATLHADLEQVRRFRNRIAHHEPIFTRNLVSDYERIRQLIEWRRPSIARWLDSNQTIRSILAAAP